MMAIFNLRRVFLPIAVGIPRASIALRKNRLMISSTFTFDNVLLFFRAMLITWVIAGYGGVKSVAAQEQLDESSIPQVPVEYAGQVELVQCDQLDLAFDEETPGIGRMYWMGFSPEGTLLITDVINPKALEFSFKDGRYIRSFGRRGKGPGEYLSARSMAIDPQGRVYLLDTTGDQIIMYDRQGQYIDRNQSLTTSRTSQLTIGPKGELFVLERNSLNTLEAHRLDPETYEMLYRTPLSTEKQRFISFRMSSIARLRYNKTLHRLYYLGPNDYLVKEIDAKTGTIVRQFGSRPKGFVPLPERYHSIERGSIQDMTTLEMSQLSGMFLIQDRYLLVCHLHPGNAAFAKRVEGIIYDLKAPDLIRSYVFKPPTKGTSLPGGGVAYTSMENRVTAWQGRLYFWMPPSLEESEKSNGRVEVYEMSFEKE